MRRLRLKLRGQLLLSYLLIMLIPVPVIGLVIHNVAEQGLTVLVTHEAEQRANAVSAAFAHYYALNGSWNGVEKLFEQFRPNPGQPRIAPRSPDNNQPGGPPDRPLPGQILI